MKKICGFRIDQTGSAAMPQPGASSPSRTRRIVGGVIALLLWAAGTAAPGAAPEQETFATPEQAAEALASAWRSGDKPGIAKIFGPDGARLASSGDEVADKNTSARLAAHYYEQHRIVRTGDEGALLVIGKEEFPIPIPLVQEGGRWRFDTAAGVEEILDRRIGRNELNAIRVCRAYVEAQRDYASRDPLGEGMHEYATRIASSEGKHDGLFWETQPGAEESPLGPLIAAAADQGYGQAGQGDMLAPFHGYYYRILTGQGPHAPGKARNYIVNGHMTGGFALIAYPAKYGNSGIMTFIVNQDGIVFQKNLGKNTAKIIRNMTQYDPDRSWKVAHLKQE
jgi:hypothetical protein